MFLFHIGYSCLNRNDSKKLSKWCYYCGKSVGIKLTPCSRCKKVFYCSNNCKQRAWNEIHKSECVLHQSTRKSAFLTV